MDIAKSPLSASAATATATSESHPRRVRWAVDALLPLALTITAGIGVWLPASLPSAARVTLFTFALAVICWSTTSLNAAYVALAAVMALILTGGSPQERLFDALASDVVWLMIGAFILAAAVQQAGLATRLTSFIVSRARTVRGMFWLLTPVLILLPVLVPSTSGQAAVAVPVFRSLAGAARDPRITRALALLMPTVILVATITTLTSAGSHLIANDLLGQIANQRISFAQWMLYGLPFGIAAGYASCWVILRLFLDRDRRNCAIQLPPPNHAPLLRAEWTTLTVAAMMILLWVSEAWHGLGIAIVAVVSALVLTLPRIGVLKWEDALKAVSWNLIIFVGAALVLGRALVESGAAQWIIDQVFAMSGIVGAESRFLILLALAGISLTSHVYMTSHTARAAALVPPLLYLAQSLDLNPTAVLFISTVGMNYCLTFPVSSKALLVFQELEGATYQPADLLRLSAVMLPIHLGLMLLFYYTYWPWVGLTL